MTEITGNFLKEKEHTNKLAKGRSWKKERMRSGVVERKRSCNLIFLLTLATNYLTSQTEPTKCLFLEVEIGRA